MAKDRIAWEARFDFAGHSYLIRCKKLDGTNLDFILSQDRKGDDAMAQGMLNSRVLVDLYEDGKERKWRLQPDGSGGFPLRFDLETGETLGKRVTREIVRRNPFLIKLAKDSFGEYADDFDDEEEEAGDPTTATGDSSPPSPVLAKPEDAA